MAFAMIPRKRTSDTLANWRDADRLFDDFFGWAGGTPSHVVGETRRAFVPRIDVTESDDVYTVTAELPGLSSEDFEVEVEDGVLTLKGEKKTHVEGDDEGARRVETHSGSFERRIRFREPIVEADVTARSCNGVLSVRVPRQAESQPEVRSVPIETS